MDYREEQANWLIEKLGQHPSRVGTAISVPLINLGQLTDPQDALTTLLKDRLAKCRGDFSSTNLL